MATFGCTSTPTPRRRRIRAGRGFPQAHRPQHRGGRWHLRRDDHEGAERAAVGRLPQGRQRHGLPLDELGWRLRGRRRSSSPGWAIPSRPTTWPRSPRSGPGHRGVGVLWSNQTSVTRRSTSPPTPTAIRTPPGCSRDRLRWHRHGRPTATSASRRRQRTGRRRGQDQPDHGNPAHRRPGPSRQQRRRRHLVEPNVSSVNQNGTRPVLVLDRRRTRPTSSSPTSPWAGHYLITRRTAPLSTLNFGAASIGTPFISNTATATSTTRRRPSR